MKRIVLALLAALSLWLWAADDAAVLPPQGVTAAPLASTLTSPASFSSFAITIPKMLSYQGKLTDSLGNPVPDGNYQLTFRLYTEETGGSPFWTEEQTITVRNGLFSALLGAVNPIGSVPDAGVLYLSLQVGTGSELTPRLRIVSAAYAFLTERAANSDLLQGRDTTYFSRAVHTHPYVDSAGGAERVGGLNLSGLDSRYVNESQANSVTSAMIVDGTIVRADVASNFKAPYSDTADYAKAAPAVDSARVAANAHKLQGKDTLALSTKFVDEGQANSVTSTMIVDGTIANADLAVNAVTGDKIQDGTVTSADIRDTTIITAKIKDGAVTSAKIQDGTIVRADVANSFKAPYSDTADYARAAPAVDSARVAANAHKLQGKDTIALSAKFVDEGQANSITSAMIVDGTVATADIANNAITSAKIGNGEVTMPKINQSGATLNQVIKWNGTQWAPGNDSFGGPPSGPAGGDLTGTYPNPTIATGAVTSAKIQDGQVANADLAANAVTGDKIQDGTVTSADIRDTTIITAKIKDGAVTSAKIADGTIVRADVASNFKAPYSDTADYAKAAPAVDSANVAANAHKLQGKDTIALSAKFVDEGQANSITSAMIVDGTITNADLGANVVTGDKIQDGTVGSLDIRDTTIITSDIKDRAVTSAKINDGTIVRTDVASNFKAPYADTADFAYVAPTSDSARAAANAHKLQGKDTLSLSNKFVDEGQANSVTSPMIADGTIANADLAANAVTGDKIQDGTVTSADIRDTTIITAKIKDGAVTSAKIADGTIVAADLNQMGAGSGQVLKWTGSAWAPRNDSVGQSDNAWVRGTPDSVLFTVRQLGIARGGSSNMLYGSYRFTHTNLGVACTTGTSGQNYYYCTVAGGYGNTASHQYATVGGGYGNRASGVVATVAGGYGNTASHQYATVGGGILNRASGIRATISGGSTNTASGDYATVGGGVGDTASGIWSTVAGGSGNTASGTCATVSGGADNTASNSYATAAGGYADTSAAEYSFTTNYHSVVPSSYSNSSAFNGEVATASNQTRVGVLSKASGSFTIDHPLDPYHKILNHYFIEGPEMLNIYRGSVILDASGRAEVKLPDYFSALNRNPHIQLTGVGTYEIYVVEDVKDNRFVIGGKPGTKVYWQVTGERQDVSAEATRRMMPVEQPKTGELAGRMLDDDFLAGCMLQLEREGKASGLDFRTAAGRARYERMKNPPKPELER